MLQQYHTKLKGTLALTDSYQTEKTLQKEKGLYKFIWVRKGSITVEIDHQEMLMSQDDVISLTHLQHLEFKSIDGEYTTLLFNSNFYCIYGNDHEVSCSGFLFNGSSHLVRFTLNEQERRQLNDITVAMENEFTVSDSLQEEMLRILLKRFIIQCTRIARHRLDITREKESGFEIVRQYYNLVDEYYKTKKQVQDYADMLHKSPKTLSNIFSTCKLPSPLRVIHERVEAEAKRLLLYSSKSAKEIADILGFEDQASFSRFFKNMTGQPVHELLLCKGSAGVQKLQESGRCSGTRKPCMARSEQHIYFLLRTGSAYHEYRYSGVLGHLLPQSGTGGRFARYHHDARYTFVPRHHAGGLGTQPRERRIRFPVTVRCRAAGD